MVKTNLKQVVTSRLDRSTAKPAEPIEMPFGLWTRVDPMKHVLD